MADLPIVPDHFRLVVRDERSKKQMNVVKRQLDRDDVELVVNACDAGREGELIFAYLYEKAGSTQAGPAAVAELDDEGGDQERVRGAAPGGELAPLEQAARSRSEADWIVGMNATRAATIRLRSLVRRRGVAGPRADADAGDPGPARGGDPRLQARALLGGRRGVRPDRRAGRADYEGRYHAGANPRVKSGEEAAAIVAACAGQTGQITKLEKSEQKQRPPLLYDLTSLQRDANTRYGFTARRTLSAAQRLYEEHKALTYPRTNSRYLTSDMISDIKPIARLVGDPARVRRGVALRPGPRRAAAGPRGQRREGHRPPRDHPDARRAPSGRQDVRRRPQDLRHGGAPLPGRLPPRGRVREHAGRDDRARARVPHPRQADPRARLARRLRRAGRRRPARRRRRGPRAAAAEARARRGRGGRARSAPRRRRRSRRGATATARCSPRWRPPASWSTTRSCARR